MAVISAWQAQFHTSWAYPLTPSLTCCLSKIAEDREAGKFTKWYAQSRMVFTAPTKTTAASLMGSPIRHSLWMMQASAIFNPWSLSQNLCWRKNCDLIAARPVAVRPAQSCSKCGSIYLKTFKFSLAAVQLLRIWSLTLSSNSHP